ncbi:had-superfamily subfamily variant 1 [Fusarium austroafricanum]|uniref:Had-superfamily subfamily variant 1 n=1 Tax=Fusarium austroafricanum TaxID=2364996 RepID=A0A8H4KC64_9HYPO|nr:had-superfamily subfamily variant 1 [Fusarium austroafricanum]
MDYHSNMVMFFDLDNTLFDHEHAEYCAMSALQNEVEDLAEYFLEDLVKQFNRSLEHVYERYHNKEITFEETHPEKIKHFSDALGFEEPDAETIEEIRAIYKAAYLANRRATPGSIELLCRLREHGYRTAIITNGEIKEQTNKAKAIGIYHLVDRIITSEEVGCPKPDICIFKYAMNQMRVPPGFGYMVGDHFEKDIRPALYANLHPIWYAPHYWDMWYTIFGMKRPVIHHMGELYNLFHLSPPASFEPHFFKSKTHFKITGLGINIVTEPRYSFKASSKTVQNLVEVMGYALRAISTYQYTSAMCFLEGILLLTFDSVESGPEDLKVSYPGQEGPVMALAQPQCYAEERKHSIFVRCELSLWVYAGYHLALLGEVAVLLQSSFNSLMKERPRQALRRILKAMEKVARHGGFDKDFLVSGAEFLDQGDKW